MTGTATAPQTATGPARNSPCPHPVNARPAGASRSKTPDQNLFTKTTRNTPEPLDAPLLTLVISSPLWGVFAVTAEGFCCGGDTLSEVCPRRRTGRHRGGPSSTDARSLTTESDEGNCRKGGWFRRYLRRYLCLQSQGPRSPVASRPGAQGRPRPEHRKRRGSSVVQALGNATESNEMSVARAGQLAARVRTRALG